MVDLDQTVSEKKVCLKRLNDITEFHTEVFRQGASFTSMNIWCA